MLPQIATTAQVISVVAGVVIAVLSFNDTRQKEAYARQVEMQARELEAAKPFLELRQKKYAEAISMAGVLSNPASQTKEELAAAKKRFGELYVAELSMVEDPMVESKMVQLAAQVDPELQTLSPAQSATLDLAHALRDNFVASWRVKPGTERER